MFGGIFCCVLACDSAKSTWVFVTHLSAKASSLLKGSQRTSNWHSGCVSIEIYQDHGGFSWRSAVSVLCYHQIHHLVSAKVWLRRCMDLMGDSMIWTRPIDPIAMCLWHKSLYYLWIHEHLFPLRRPSLSYGKAEHETRSFKKSCHMCHWCERTWIILDLLDHRFLVTTRYEVPMDYDTAPLLESGGSSGPRTRKPWRGNDLREFVWNSKTCCGSLDAKEPCSKPLLVDD